MSFKVNGNLDELTESSGLASAMGVYISDGDVYVGGRIRLCYIHHVLENGELITVASGTVSSTSGGHIAVKGNDVI